MHLHRSRSEEPVLHTETSLSTDFDLVAARPIKLSAALSPSVRLVYAHLSRSISFFSLSLYSLTLICFYVKCLPPSYTRLSTCRHVPLLPSTSFSYSCLCVYTCRSRSILILIDGFFSLFLFLTDLQSARRALRHLHQLFVLP